MGAIGAVVLVVVVIGLTRSATPGCAYPEPVPTLSAALRAQGGFDQAFDASDLQNLGVIAAEAAGTLSPNLQGTVAGRPVDVAATDASRPSALVVPLTARSGGHIIGLVAFLRDCAGRAWFSSVDDLSAAGGTLSAFPAVAADAARARLGPGAVLAYSSSPYQPVWRDPATGRTIPAT